MALPLSISKCGKKPAAMAIWKLSLIWATSTKMDLRKKNLLASLSNLTLTKLWPITRKQQSTTFLVHSTTLPLSTSVMTNTEITKNVLFICNKQLKRNMLSLYIIWDSFTMKESSSLWTRTNLRILSNEQPKKEISKAELCTLNSCLTMLLIALSIN